MIEFRGRVLISESGEGEAVVSKKQISFLKAFEKSAQNTSKKLLMHDKNGEEIYKKNISGKVFVLPSFKKSDIHAFVLLSIAMRDNLPKCFLIAEKLDEVAVSAFSTIKAYLNKSISVIDSLGKDFLQAVENGDTISFNDNVVVINI